VRKRVKIRYEPNFAPTHRKRKTPARRARGESPHKKRAGGRGKLSDWLSAAGEGEAKDGGIVTFPRKEAETDSSAPERAGLLNSFYPGKTGCHESHFSGAMKKNR